MYFRPLWHLWLSLQYELFGFNAFFVHLSQLSLHFINMLLAYVLFRKLGFARLICVATISLWTILGGNAYAISWPNQASDLLALFLLLLAHRAWTTYFQGGEQHTQHLLLSGFFWLGSMFSKEMGLLFPALMAGSRLVKANPCETLGRRLRDKSLLIPVFFLAAYVLIKMLYHGTEAAGGLNVDRYAPSTLSNMPAGFVLMGRMIHYIEGLMYLFFPLDLLESWWLILVILICAIPSFAYMCLRLSMLVRSRSQILYAIVFSLALPFTRRLTHVPVHFMYRLFGRAFSYQ